MCKTLISLLTYCRCKLPYWTVYISCFILTYSVKSRICSRVTNDLPCSVTDAETAGNVNDAQVCWLHVALLVAKTLWTCYVGQFTRIRAVITQITITAWNSMACNLEPSDSGPWMVGCIWATGRLRTQPGCPQMPTPQISLSTKCPIIDTVWWLPC